MKKEKHGLEEYVRVNNMNKKKIWKYSINQSNVFCYYCKGLLQNNDEYEIAKDGLVLHKICAEKVIKIVQECLGNNLNPLIQYVNFMENLGD